MRAALPLLFFLIFALIAMWFLLRESNPLLKELRRTQKKMTKAIKQGRVGEAEIYEQQASRIMALIEKDQRDR